MNPLDHAIRRLLRAAARAQDEAPATMPFFLEIRILDRWRSPARDEPFTQVPVVFWRAVACACLIIVLSVGWSWWGSRSSDAGVAAFANYEAKLQVLP